MKALSLHYAIPPEIQAVLDLKLVHELEIHLGAYQGSWEDFGEWKGEAPGSPACGVTFEGRLEALGGRMVAVQQGSAHRANFIVWLPFQAAALGLADELMEFTPGFSPTDPRHTVVFKVDDPRIWPSATIQVRRSLREACQGFLRAFQSFEARTQTYDRP